MVQKPEKIAVIILKFEQCGSIIEQQVRKMPTDWRTGKKV